MRRRRRKSLDVAIVEDSPDLARLFEFQLGALGHRVVEMRTAEFERFVDEGFETCPDVALVNILLGAQVDGLDVARSIREHCPNAGVVICSAVPVAFRREIDRLVAEGIVDQVLTKPISMKEVDAAVRAAGKGS